MNIKEALEIAESDACYSVEETVKAGQTLAAEVRRLTVLRPMESAPVGRAILIRREDNKCFYMANIDKTTGELVFWGGAYDKVYFTPTGWLPLPTPINEGEL